MSDTSIRLEDVHLNFPRTKAFLGSVEQSIGTFLNLRKSIDDSIPALNGVSLDVKEGEVMGVIGRNGSGKSTMLRAISGIYRPDKGRVLCKGKISLLARLGVGFNVNLTGRENIYLSSSILGLSKIEVDALIETIIDFSGINDFIDQPLRTYSSGMRARLGFAVVSAIKPETLLIDEVLSVGDQEFREVSALRIKEMVKQARTVLIVSHNFNTLREICNRMVLLDKGKIKAIGEPEEVIEAYSKLE
tara:strand:+ start:1097 stop:1834 length:738 start_codon:yes stop_codon:yes gene_type:complete